MYMAVLCLGVPWSYGADVADKSGSYAQIATYVNDVRK